jgi:hypothetical protein
MNTFSEDPAVATVKEATNWLREHVKGTGAECPVCKRFAKAYRRKLNAGMACSLIHMYHLENSLRPLEGWVHFSKELLKLKKNAVAREYSKLRFWGLAEPSPNADSSTPGTGYWRITEKGRSFVEGVDEVPRWVWVYNNNCFATALGDKFDYDELMRGI